MSKFEFIPEASIVRNTDPSPGQKFMDPFDAVFEAIQNSGDNPLNQKNCVKVHINHEKVYKNDLKFLELTKSMYSNFLFLHTSFCFNKYFSFLITVARGIFEISEIDDALIPFFGVCFKSRK